MIEIHLTDLHNESPKHLLAIATALATIAGRTAAFFEKIDADRPSLDSAAHPGAQALAAADNPAAGAVHVPAVPVISGTVIKSLPEPVVAAAAVALATIPDPVAAFGQAPALDVPDPAQAFGGNVGAAIASSPPGVTPQITALAVPAPAQAGASVDADGLPWDARIHASSKATNADGRWRGKRGVDDAVVTQVTAELKAVMAIPAPAAAAGVPLVPVPALPNVQATADIATVVPAPPSTIAPQPVVPAAPSAAPAPGAVLTMPAAPNGALTFPSILQRITAARTAQKVTDAQISECCVALGLPSLPLLATRPDLLPAFAAELDKVIAA
jgi:hypothetical protein